MPASVSSHLTFGQSKTPTRDAALMRPSAQLQLAARSLAIQPFEVMDVLARADALTRAGRHIVRMEIGEPDFTAAPLVVEAATQAMRDGLSAYTPALGITELRQAIARFYAQRHARVVDPQHVAVTAGASGALLLTLAAIVGPGDEVLVPDPGYPCYRAFVRVCEATATALPVEVTTNFQPTLEQVRAAWGPNTRALIIGSPSNPTGTVIDPITLTSIAEFIASRNGVLIVDEIYDGLIYEGHHQSAAGLPGHVVVINSFSKYFCMTGWRLGWAVLPASLVRAVEKLAQHLFICPPSLSQRAACAAFLPDTITLLEARRLQFQQRRDYLVPALEGIGFKFQAKPQGAFYLFADCATFSHDARAFTLDTLLEKAGVAATPGCDFGQHHNDRYVRFAYTRGMADLEEAVRRIASVCAA